MRFRFLVGRNLRLLLPLAMLALASSCVKGGFQLPVKGLGATGGYTMVSGAGDVIELSGLHSISYDAKSHPAVRFHTVSLVPAGAKIGSWSIPWVILDSLESSRDLVQVSDVGDRFAEKSFDQPNHFQFELDYVDALTAVSQKRLLEWGFEPDSKRSGIHHLRFDGQDLDPSEGTLLILKYDEQRQVQIEQRIWRGNFEKEVLSGAGSPPEFGSGTQEIARLIFDELGL